jgi:phosphatidate phosphatase APP1
MERAKRLAHRTAIAAERLIDRFRPPERRKPVLEPYRGYATPDTLVFRGRVLAGLRRDEPTPERSKWVNFKQMLSLFMTDEVADVVVTTTDGSATTVSDEEGYIRLELPRPGDAPAGWTSVTLSIAGQKTRAVDFPALVPSAVADFGVISDIDDTMLETGAYSLARNLWTTFTGSAATRRVFPGSIALMRALQEAGEAPVYYVSSSPWNLHAFLDGVLAGAGLPAGPMFLRDLGISESQFVSGTHGDHKGAAIDQILAANPGLGFVLLGDTGQHDAHVYGDAIRRHPGRIAAVALHEPGPGADAEDKAAIEAIADTGTPVFSAPDFSDIHEQILAVLEGPARPD